MGFNGNNVLGESVSSVTLVPSVELGTRATIGGNDYIYVFNAGNSEIPPARGVVLSATSGYSVTLSSTTTTDFMIGICKHSTMATAAYGWVLTQGFASFLAGASDSFTVGGPIGIAADGAFAFKSSVTGYTGPVVGKVMVSSPSAGSAGLGFFKFI